MHALSVARVRLLAALTVVLLLIASASPAIAKPGAKGAGGARTVGDTTFIGSAEFATGYEFDGTEVGGLSGIVYDKYNDVYYALSDDKSEVNDARFYSLTIDISDGTLDDGDIEFVDVTYLTDADGNRFLEGTLDPEGFELVKKNHLFIGSERDTNDEPWIKRFDLSGRENMTLPLPAYFIPTGDPQSGGVHTNLAFESLTVTPNGRYLYTATENALVQDGPIATISDESPSRVLEYRLNGNRMNHLRTAREFVYMVSPIPAQNPGECADNGLVELQSIDNFGTFLAMERSYACRIGNTVRIFQTSTVGATDVSGWDSIEGRDYSPMSKRLVLDLADSGVQLDNLEGMALGPKMEDSRYPLFIMTDNNFNDHERTLVMAYVIDLDH